MKKEKGITLVALVITIVVMLILATVTVTVSINGGLINTTKSAKEESRGMDVAEAKEMWEMSVREDRENGNQEKTLDQILEELKNKENQELNSKRILGNQVDIPSPNIEEDV